MEKCRWAIGGVLALVLLCSATSGPAADEKTPPDQKAVADSKAGDEAVFDMKEIALFDQKEEVAISSNVMYGGQNAIVTTQPAKDVKAYPKLNSKQPLYGSIVFNRMPGNLGSATKFYFVLDESGTTEKADEKAAKPDAPKRPINNAPMRHYDRLYFDFNHDLDLTNDAVISPFKDPPKGLERFIASRPNMTVFDTISVPLGEDPKAKESAVRVLPMIVTYGNSGQAMFAAASGRKGEIRVGKRAYSAVLVPRGGMFTHVDSPNTQLTLTPVDGTKSASSYPWLNTLGAIREADGEFYKLSATPSGDKLTVRPFGGDRGVLELSAGKKDVKPLGMVGILTLDQSMLSLGDLGYPVPAGRAKTATYRLPVGDYRPMMLNVDYGDLQVSLRADYTRNVLGASKQSGSIEIRKDKPYVLDFSAKPEVSFQSPAEGQVFKLGEQVRLAAVLKIPDKGLLIGGLQDMSKKVGEMRWMGEDGKPVTIPRYASLDPTVVITDSAGKKVAEGTMPFG
jgi:hypothetical protein